MDDTVIKTVIFDVPIQERQVRWLRGAFMSLFPDGDDLLHNHLDDKFRYAYPLVQYKRIDGRAAIMAFNEAVDLLDGLDEGVWIELRLGNDAPRRFTVQEVRHTTANFATGTDLLPYRLHNWLPLSQKNYAQYTSLDSLAAKATMLEKILTGNILSAAKGLGHHIDRQIECRITDLGTPRVLSLKDVKMMSVDVGFRANILLPDHMGLGKSVSKGFGIVLGV